MYALYLAAITNWNVSLPIQVLGTILTTILIYMAGQGTGGPRVIRDRAVLLGKYSLFGYIAHIAILQTIRRLSWTASHEVSVLIASLLAGFVLTLMVVELMDWATLKSRTVKWWYQLVFA